jgi:hypothetical protein
VRLGVISVGRPPPEAGVLERVAECQPGVVVRHAEGHAIGGLAVAGFEANDPGPRANARYRAADPPRVKLEPVRIGGHDA